MRPRPFWVTVQNAPGRTQDHRIDAPTAWSAAWLWRQLHPGATALLTRPVPPPQEA